jgi:hypothetical protein
MNVLIGTPIHRQGAYVLDKFLANQKEIQKLSPACEILFTTVDGSYAAELRDTLARQGLKGTAICYKVEKPAGAQSRLWNIASGREAIRRYFLTQTDARELLFLDADMTFDPAVAGILEKEISGYSAVFSGYPIRGQGVGLAGAGCLMLTREAAEKIKIRCVEFKGGETIFEDNLIEMDIFSLGGRIKKGFFVEIDHYSSPAEARHIVPQRVGLGRRITNQPLLRYLVIRASLLLHCNIPWRLFNLKARVMGKG